MRFFNLSGVLQRARRAVSRSASVSSEEVKDPQKLSEVIRLLSVRVQELEAKQVPDAVEIVKDITGTAGVPVVVSFTHNFGSQVRWYPVYWSSAITVAPALVYNTTSTPDMLVLTSYSAGRIILRIEPSQYGYT